MTGELDIDAHEDDPTDVRGRSRHLADHSEGIERATECFAFLRSVPILFEIDDTTLWEIARSVEECEFPVGSRVVAQDEDSGEARFYVIRSGSADVLRRDRGGTERVVARLSVGSYFGELGLLTNQSRNATVRVHGTMPLRAYSFDALTFHRRIAEHVLVFRVLRDREQADTELDSASTASRSSGPGGKGRLRLKQLALLRRLPEADLDAVLDQAEHRWHPAGSTIVQQGDPGDRFYIVLEGTVAVQRDHDEVAELRAGDFFGETALLLDMPRTATVAARTPVQTWSITRPAFQELVGGYLLANPRTQDEIMRRMRTALPSRDGASELQPDLDQ